MHAHIFWKFRNSTDSIQVLQRRTHEKQNLHLTCKFHSVHSLTILHMHHNCFIDEQYFLLITWWWLTKDANYGTSQCRNDSSKNTPVLKNISYMTLDGMLKNNTNITMITVILTDFNVYFPLLGNEPLQLTNTVPTVLYFYCLLLSKQMFFH